MQPRNKGAKESVRVSIYLCGIGAARGEKSVVWKKERADVVYNLYVYV